MKAQGSIRITKVDASSIDPSIYDYDNIIIISSLSDANSLAYGIGSLAMFVGDALVDFAGVFEENVVYQSTEARIVGTFNQSDWTPVLTKNEIFDLAEGKRTIYSNDNSVPSGEANDLWIPSATVTGSYIEVAGSSSFSYLDADDYNTALKITFTNDTKNISGNLKITFVDAEGGIVAALNGVELSPNMSGANNATVTYEFSDVAFNSNSNEVAFWNPGDNDGGSLSKIEVQYNYIANEVYLYDEDNGWVLATSYTENLVDFVNNIYTPSITSLEDQVDSQISYYFTSVTPGSNPTTYTYGAITNYASISAVQAAITANWTTAQLKLEHNGDLLYDSTEQVGFYYSYDRATDIASWKEIDGSQNAGVIQALNNAADAQATADGKVNHYYAWWSETDIAPNTSNYKYWLKTNGLMYNWNESSWVDMKVSTAYALDVGDLATVHKVFTDGTIDDYSYEYNGTSWQQLTSQGVVAGSSAITNLTAEVENGTNTWAAADSTLENSLTVKIEDDVAVVESKFEYGSTVKIGEAYYSTGFGLVAIGNSGTGDIGDPFNSKFKVNADEFVLEDPVTGNSVEMSEDGLFFKRPNGVTYKYLQNITTFRGAKNGTPITLHNMYSKPELLMSPASMPVYRTDYKEQDQTFTFDIANEIDLSNDSAHTYQFTPYAQLTLSSSVFNDDITGEFSNTSVNTKYSDSYFNSSLLSQFNGKFTIQSTRGTGVANTYYYRECTVTLQSSTDNINFTSLASTTIEFGASTASINGTVTYDGNINASTYIRMKFVYADSGGTFTTGETGYMDYQTINYTKTATTQRTSNNVLKCSSSKYYYSNASIGQVRYDNSKSYYIGNSGISAEDIRDSQKPGYTITSFSVSSRHVSGCTLSWSSAIFTSNSACVAYNRGSSYSSSSSSAFNDVFYPVSYHSGNSPWCSGVVTSALDFTVYCQKYIEESGNTDTVNSGTNFTLTATAAETTILAEGTLDIVIIA